MLKTIALVLVLLVAGVLIYAATKPDTFRIERSITIKAPPEKVHALISNFDAWAQWSPWEKKDPAMKRTRSGPPSGVGSVYAWDGNKAVGQGRMEITESTVPSRVLIKLDFISPFEAHNMADFTLTPQGDGTRVNWAMVGPSPYISKLMTTFFSMEAMVGPDFEAGLSSLKALAEKS
ncbi:MAG: SRPBCC family protein [Ramlibacter sp.]|nr:SRPBCC family protein [Ramlibacter sp.]